MTEQHQPPIIKAGHRYVRRDGTVTPPMRHDPSWGCVDPETGLAYGCDASAGWRVYPMTKRDHLRDLMEEYTDDA